MPRLIRVFVGSTDHFVGLVLWQLICLMENWRNYPFIIIKNLAPYLFLWQQKENGNASLPCCDKIWTGKNSNSLSLKRNFECCYIAINSPWLSDTGNICTCLLIGFATLSGNISCIWKSMWINQYITFFFTEHLKFISICFNVFKRSLLKHRYNYVKGYNEKCFFKAATLFWNGQASIDTITQKNISKVIFYGRHFLLKWTSYLLLTLK